MCAFHAYGHFRPRKELWINLLWCTGFFQTTSGSVCRERPRPQETPGKLRRQLPELVRSRHGRRRVQGRRKGRKRPTRAGPSNRSIFPISRVMLKCTLWDTTSNETKLRLRAMDLLSQKISFCWFWTTRWWTWYFTEVVSVRANLWLRFALRTPSRFCSLDGQESTYDWAIGPNREISRIDVMTLSQSRFSCQGSGLPLEVDALKKRRGKTKDQRCTMRVWCRYLFLVAVWLWVLFLWVHANCLPLLVWHVRSDTSFTQSRSFWKNKKSFLNRIEWGTSFRKIWSIIFFSENISTDA